MPRSLQLIIRTLVTIYFKHFYPEFQKLNVEQQIFVYIPLLTLCTDFVVMKNCLVPLEKHKHKYYLIINLSKR